MGGKSLKPIPIPSSTVEAYGAQYVTVTKPEGFELGNGQEIEPFEGMKVGEVVYALIGIENEDEWKALDRTRCFYLGFVSGFIPIFQLRVADVIANELESEEVLPVIYDDFDLHQLARSEWASFGDFSFIQVPIRSRFVFKAHTDKGLTTESEIIEEGQFLIHNFATGATGFTNKEWLDFMYGGDTGELRPVDDEGFPKTNPGPEAVYIPPKEEEDKSEPELQESGDSSKEDTSVSDVLPENGDFTFG